MIILGDKISREKNLSFLLGLLVVSDPGRICFRNRKDSEGGLRIRYIMHNFLFYMMTLGCMGGDQGEGGIWMQVFFLSSRLVKASLHSLEA